jgi:streptogramin lyase
MLLPWPFRRRTPRAAVPSAKPSARFYRPGLEWLEDRCAPAVIAEIPMPGGLGSSSFGITAGPDGNLWFTDIGNIGSSKIGKLTPGGAITEYSLAPYSDPNYITLGPDNNLWFTEGGTNRIGKITPAGAITEYSVPFILSPTLFYGGITAGSDGYLWFADDNDHLIGKISTAGVPTQVRTLALGSHPSSIVAGPDGNLWFTEYGGNNIAKLSTDNSTFTEYTLPSGGNPNQITVGPDGDLWFTEGSGRIGKITTGGTITEFTVAPSSSDLFGITAAPDGNLWFTEHIFNKIGEITPTGVLVSQYTIPSANRYPLAISAGADGNLWFTESNGGKISKVILGGLASEFTATTGSEPWTITLGADGNLYFPEYSGNKIGWMTTTGQGPFEYPLPDPVSHPTFITTGPDNNIYVTAPDTGWIDMLPLGGTTVSHVYFAGGSPQGITAGPDGNLWFVENSNNHVVAITTAGAVVHDVALPAGYTQPYGITAGPDGNLWFTNYNATTSAIGKITTAGVITEFPIAPDFGQPRYITAGPDGNLWFTSSNTMEVGRMSTGGAFSAFSIPESYTGYGLYQITPGPDGNVWCADWGSDRIWKITPSGTASSFYVGSGPGSTGITGITAGPDGNLYFADWTNSKIGKLSQTIYLNPAYLPAATVGNAYYQVFTGGGGSSLSPSYTYAKTGALPPGMTFTTDGLLSGTPTVAGSYTFTVTATFTGNPLPNAGATGSTTYTLVVNPVITISPGTLPVALLASVPALAINAGGAAVGSFVNDVDFSGGNLFSASDPIDTSAVTNPAPQGVYDTERYSTSSFTYTIPGLTPGTNYTVRLHFAEIFYTAAGQRLFNVSINGTGVLGDFDIYATAGGKDKAIVEQFSATADGSGDITIQFTNVLNGAKISGIEIVPPASYMQTIKAAGGSGTGYTFSETGTLPPGLTLAASGLLSGTPTSTGTYNFTVYVTDSNGGSGSKTFSLTVNPTVGLGVLQEVTALTAGSYPWSITSGPDGNLWFTERAGNRIGRISPAGTLFESSSLLTASSAPYDITTGPDGNLWFAEYSAGKIGRITPAGNLLPELTPPTSSSGPVGIVTGPDGNIWFTEYNVGQIARYNPTTTMFTETAVPSGASSAPWGIVAGPDGNLWFAESRTGKIGKITTAATPVITEYTIPGGSSPTGITVGADGNLWFVDSLAGLVGKVAPGTGTITTYAVPGFVTELYHDSIAAGPDGNVWFTSYQGGLIGKITPTGVITLFPVPGTGPQGITAGPDGNVWFTEAAGETIGKITQATTTISGPGSVVAGQPASFLVTVTGAGPVPTGIVTFYDGSQVIASSPLNGSGQATFVTSALALGTHILKAVYSGDPNYAGNAVNDPGFAIPNVGTNVGTSYQYNPSGSPWTFSSSSPSGSGVAGNASDFTSGNPNAPLGTQVAFLQETGTISQTLSFAAGSYEMSLLAAQRGDFGQSAQTFQVNVDGTAVGTITPVGLNYATYTTNPFTVTPGVHTIQLVGLNPLGGDNTALIGSVSLISVASVNVVAPAVIALSPGTLPVAALNVAYTAQQLNASGGNGSYTFSKVGTLPPGMAISTSGVISGTPTSTGTYNFTVNVTDTNGGSGSWEYLLTVDPASTTTVTPPVSPVAGFPASFLITVSGSSGPRTGTVSLFDNTTSMTLGSAILNASGQATIVTLGLTTPPTTHSITASYQGDATYAPSTSSPVSVTVLSPLTYTGWQIPPSLKYTYRRRLAFGPFQTGASGGTSIGTGFNGEEVTGPLITLVLNSSAQANVTVGSSQAAGIMARVQGDGSAYVAVLTSTGQAQIWLYNGSTAKYTVLASAPTPGGITSGSLQFVLNGPSLALYLNGSGTALVSTTDSTLTAAGGVGIFAFGPGGTVDNFVVGGS